MVHAHNACDSSLILTGSAAHTIIEPEMDEHDTEGTAMTTEPTASPLTDAEVSAVSDKLIAWAATLTPRECGCLFALLSATPDGENEVTGHMIGGSLLAPAVPGIVVGTAAPGSSDSGLNMPSKLIQAKNDMMKGIINNFRV